MSAGAISAVGPCGKSPDPARGWRYPFKTLTASRALSSGTPFRRKTLPPLSRHPTTHNRPWGYISQHPGRGADAHPSLGMTAGARTTPLRSSSPTITPWGNRAERTSSSRCACVMPCHWSTFGASTTSSPTPIGYRRRSGDCLDPRTGVSCHGLASLV